MSLGKQSRQRQGDLLWRPACAHKRAHQAKQDRLWMQFTGRTALTAAQAAALLGSDTGVGALFAVAR